VCAENSNEVQEQHRACQKEIFRLFKSAAFEEIVAKSDDEVRRQRAVHFLECL